MARPDGRHHPGLPFVHTAAPTARPLDPYRILRDAALTLALVLLNLGGNIGAAAFFVILVGMSLWSSPAAYKAVFISTIGLALNEAFVPKSLLWTPARVALPMLVFARFLLDLALNRRGGGLSAPYIAFLLYVFTMAGCSYASGWYTHIALLKLFNFWILITMVFAGGAILRRSNVDLTEWFASQILAVALVGIAATATGQSRNFMSYRTGDASMMTADSLFNGAFLHPNAHAAYASLFVMFLVSIFLFSPYRNRTLTLPLIVTWIIFMVYSQSRTAIISTLVPLIVVLPFAARKAVRRQMVFKPHVSRLTLTATGIALLFGLFVVDAATNRAVTKQVVMFLHKWDKTETTELDTETMLSSRQGKIDESWANFQENKLHGIGFGVAKNEYFIRSATLFTAPAEKGFLITAVLEEGGILGASALVLFLLTTIISLMRALNAPGLLALACMLTSNMGEVTMFSPGGSGTFLWMMFGAATALGDHCWTPVASSNAPPRRPGPAAWHPAASHADGPAVGVPLANVH